MMLYLFWATVRPGSRSHVTYSLIAFLDSAVCVARCLWSSSPRSLHDCGICHTRWCRLLLASRSVYIREIPRSIVFIQYRGDSYVWQYLRPDLLELALSFKGSESSFGSFRALSTWFYRQPWGRLTRISMDHA